jgi:hypothetical protein
MGLPVRLSVNGKSFEVASTDELREALSRFAKEEFREIWLNVPYFPALSVLANKNGGWLMYLREAGDAGLGSRNPAYRGNDGELAVYRLGNGQVDQYPASWALSEADIFEALAYFVEHKCRPPFIAWHDDVS